MNKLADEEIAREKFVATGEWLIVESPSESKTKETKEFDISDLLSQMERADD